MSVKITTPRDLHGPWIREVSELPLQRKFNLDAPHQVVVQHALWFGEGPQPVTTVAFQYSAGFASTTAYNEGLSDAEDDIIIVAVKRAFEIDVVYFSTEVIEFKQG